MKALFFQTRFPAALFLVGMVGLAIEATSKIELRSDVEIRSMVGGQSVMPLCKDPCRELGIQFGECFHFPKPNMEDCHDFVCFKNFYYWSECADGEPLEGEECCIEYDPDAIYRQQEMLVLPPGETLDCGDQNYSEPPGWPGGPLWPGGPIPPCIFSHPFSEGRCFVDSCYGGLLEVGATKIGRFVCATCPPVPPATGDGSDGEIPIP